MSLPFYILFISIFSALRFIFAHAARKLTLLIHKLLGVFLLVWLCALKFGRLVYDDLREGNADSVFVEQQFQLAVQIALHLVFLLFRTTCGEAKCYSGGTELATPK